MQQEDYIKRQIDQLGQVLGKILAYLSGSGTSGTVGEGFQAVDQALKEEIGMNVSELVAIPADQFIQFITETRMLNADNLEQLADLFYLLGVECDKVIDENQPAQKFYERSLMMYEQVEETSSTYSFDRHLRMKEIKTLL
ncbi:MAG: hypothetical protein ACOYNC_10150 [Bacteroidales bacterium]